MKRRFSDDTWFWVAVGLGLAASTGEPFGLAVAVGMPFACFMRNSRLAAFESAFGYYAAGLWPGIPGLQRYIGTWVPPAIAVLIWLTCALSLSLPWTLAWTSDRKHCIWRAPAALVLTIVPPIGLIGFISPVAGLGYLFPRCGWAGLLTGVLLPGTFLALTNSPASSRRTLPLLSAAGAIALAAGAHISRSGMPISMPGWTAIDTRFGDVSRPFKDYEATLFIQQTVAESNARVLIFPEFVVPRWSEVTQVFWARTLQQCRDRGQVLVIGAGIPRRGAAPAPEIGRSFDFAAGISALRNAPAKSSTGLTSLRADLDPEPFDNTLLILGSENGVFLQRVPVPLGMWRPFGTFSVPLRLTSPGVALIDHERAAVLICYEQMITWPVLTSMAQRPTVLVGISNTFWFNGSAIPRFQASALRSWALLFDLPVLSAVNS